MKISSTAFENNESIPSKFTCDGENINPPLVFEDIPDDSKSLVLIMDDPDSLYGSANPGWLHWGVFNIDPLCGGITEDSVPNDGVEIKTDFKELGYGGPCPHKGEHRYFFRLYALDTTLELTENSTKAEIEAALEDHILDQAEIMGLYKRD